MPIRSTRTISFVASAVLVLTRLPGPAAAQQDRLELGQRLRPFENAVEAHGDAAARRRAMADLKKVTFLFLAGQVSQAARLLDRARLALESDHAPDAATLWGCSVAVRPASHLVPCGTTKLGLTIGSTYSAGEPPAGAEVRCSLLHSDAKTVGAAVVVEVRKLPQDAELTLKDLGEGDYRFQSAVVVADKELAATEQGLSVVRDPAGRLDRLRKALGGLSDDVPSIDGKTLGLLVAVLDDLHKGKPAEMNYPAARLFADAEQLAALVRDGKRYHGPDRVGQHWLAVPTRDGVVPARVQVPETLKKGRPVPLVIALHGAGGSENLFFDGYGKGLAARLCAKRGWLMVSPRGGLRPGFVEEIERTYPVDTKRVFLVGHSMGAAQAVAAAGRSPEQFAAVAALGGGGGFARSDALVKLPFFVGVGTEDFMLAPARGLAAALEKAGVRKMVLRQYPDVEHLLVVQLGLADVFAFFDEAARR